MRTLTVALFLLVAFTGVIAATPAAVAQPPNIGDGCGSFHWHNGNVAQGTLPGYHYHHCY